MALFCSHAIFIFLCLAVMALQEMLAFPDDVNAVPAVYADLSNFSTINSLCRSCRGRDVCKIGRSYFCAPQSYCSLVNGEYYECSTHRKTCSNISEDCTDDYQCCEPSANKCARNKCCKRLKAICNKSYECCTGVCHEGQCCKPTGARCRFNDQCCSQNCDRATNEKHGLCKESIHSACSTVGEYCWNNSSCCGTENLCSTTTWRCCKMKGSHCQLDGDCCFSNVCHKGECCKVQNMQCFRSDECCPGFYCSNEYYSYSVGGFCKAYRRYDNLPVHESQFRQLQLLTDKEIAAAAAKNEKVEDINDETSD